MRNWIFFSFTVLFFFAAQPAYAEVDLSGYCDDGYYKIPNEPVCSRAPNCGGYDYDELNVESKMPSYNSCMGNGEEGRQGKGCAGYVPLCCYEMARTGQYTKCIGYWERLWCTDTQCDQAQQRGASNDECGGSCDCAHAFNSYCGDKEAVPIEQRMGMPAAVPTATTTPTRMPTAMPTARPTQGLTPQISPSTTPRVVTRVPTRDDRPRGVITPASQGEIAPTAAPTMVLFPTAQSSTLPTGTMPTSAAGLSSFVMPVTRTIITIRTAVPPEVVVEKTAQALDVPVRTTEKVKAFDQRIEETANTWIAAIITYLTGLVK